MRAIIQRVSHAQVDVEQHTIGRIGSGMLILVGFEPADTDEDLTWLSGKIARLRLFDDGMEP